MVTAGLNIGEKFKCEKKKNLELKKHNDLIKMVVSTVTFCTLTTENKLPSSHLTLQGFHLGIFLLMAFIYLGGLYALGSKADKPNRS